MPTLLQRREDARRRRRAALCAETRRRLRSALAELLPGSRVIVFGSLTRPERFHEDSDVDVALIEVPEGLDELRLMAELEERLERPVDVLRLSQCRFRDKIMREGEVWTL